MFRGQRLPDSATVMEECSGDLREKGRGETGAPGAAGTLCKPLGRQKVPGPFQPLCHSLAPWLALLHPHRSPSCFRERASAPTKLPDLTVGGCHRNARITGFLPVSEPEAAQLFTAVHNS